MKYFMGAVLGVCIFVNGFSGTVAEDENLLQGTWLPRQAELAGQPMADEVLKTISLKLENGKYFVSVAGSPDKGTYKLDTGATPKGMTISSTEGANQGKTFPAIYEIKGDTLRICYDLSGAKRPTEFKTVAGTKLYLVTYARQKKAAN